MVQPRIAFSLLMIKGLSLAARLRTHDILIPVPKSAGQRICERLTEKYRDVLIVLSQPIKLRANACHGALNPSAKRRGSESSKKVPAQSVTG